MPLDGSSSHYCVAPNGLSQAHLGFDSADWPRRPRRCQRKITPPETATQLALHLEDVHCTNLMLRVEATLRRLALTGEPMPTYELLNTLAGGRNRSSVFRAVQRLANLRRLRVQQEPQRRRVIMLFDGRATQWSPFRPGHAPKSRKKALTKKVAAKPRNYFRPSGLGILPKPVPAAAAPRALAADGCQFPLWADDMPPSGIYCGDKPLRGQSWCACHRALMFAPKKSR